MNELRLLRHFVDANECATFVTAFSKRFHEDRWMGVVIQFVNEGWAVSVTSLTGGMSMAHEDYKIKMSDFVDTWNALHGLPEPARIPGLGMAKQ